MNAKSVNIIAVTAIVIVMCLLFSWVQYNDQDGDAGEGMSGEWYSVYVYRIDSVADIEVPKSLTVTVERFSVTVTYGQSVTDFVLASDCEGVSAAGYSAQPYLDDGTLYVISLVSTGNLQLTYLALSKNNETTIFGDEADLTWTYDPSLRSTDGTGFGDNVVKGYRHGR